MWQRCQFATKFISIDTDLVPPQFLCRHKGGFPARLVVHESRASPLRRPASPISLIYEKRLQSPISYLRGTGWTCTSRCRQRGIARSSLPSGRRQGADDGCEGGYAPAVALDLSGREASKGPQRRWIRRAIWLTNRTASVVTKPGAARLPRARGRIVAVLSLASCHVSHSL